MFTQALKRLIAQTSVVAVLFTQLAVAAYACSAVEGPAKIFSALSAEDMHAAMPGCEMGDSGNPNLCVQHCQAGDQSVRTTPEVSIPAFAAVSALEIIAPAQLNFHAGITVLSVLTEHATSPPPLVRFGVLRI